MKKSYKLANRRISGKAGCDRCLTKAILAQIYHARGVAGQDAIVLFAVSFLFTLSTCLGCPCVKYFRIIDLSHTVKGHLTLKLSFANYTTIFPYNRKIVSKVYYEIDLI